MGYIEALEATFVTEHARCTSISHLKIVEVLAQITFCVKCVFNYL